MAETFTMTYKERHLRYSDSSGSSRLILFPQMYEDMGPT